MKQEFKMTAKNKGFIIITIIGPFLILAVSVLPSLFAVSSDVPEGTTVAVVGADRQFSDRLSAELEDSNIRLVERNTGTDLEEQVVNEKIHGYLELPEQPLEGEYRYYSKTGTDLLVSERMSHALSAVIVQSRLEQAGIQREAISGILEEPAFTTKKIGSGKAGDDSESGDYFSVFAVVMTFVMLLYMTILLYGQMIGRSIVSEKTTKTVEILLSSVRPIDLMFGKIFGKGLAGLLQYAIWIGIALLITLLAQPVSGFSLPDALSPANLFFLVLFFVLAFFLYASAYSAVGSGAVDEQHLGHLGWPLIIFLVIPLITISAHIMNPGQAFTVFLSHFPMTSPIVMLIRIMIDTPPVWEIITSIGILVGTIIGFILLAAKIFRVGILMTGKRFRLREILRWVR